MGFQRGDKSIVINSKIYGLRLTMGGLAELNTRLHVTGPQDLSGRLRSLSASRGRVLLACVMQPCLPSKDCAHRLVASFSESDIAAAMPSICTLFEEAFSHEP